MKNNHSTLGVMWDADGTSVRVVMEDGEATMTTRLSPIEVEAMILHLCQSPWRLIDRVPDGVSLH